MKNHKALKPHILFALCGILSSASALGGEIGVLGGLDYSRQSYSLRGAEEPEAKSKAGFAAGLSFTQQTLTEVLTFEADALYVYRKSGGRLPVTGADLESAYKYIEIPVLLRYSLFSIASVGLGGYYARGLGDIKTDYAYPGSTISLTQGYSEVSRSRSDVGLVAAAGAQLPLSFNVNARFDARYMLGLWDIDNNPDNNVKWRSWQFLLGLTYGL